MTMSDKYLDRTINERYRVDTKRVGDSVGPLYKAYDEVIERTVVVKFVRLDIWSSIRSVVQKVADFDYPYMVDMFDFGSSAGEQFVVQRYIQGDTLRDLIQRGEFKGSNPLAPRILLSIAAVLDFLSGEGYVHVVPTPDRIIVETDGKTYLADYNLTWIINAQQKRFTPSSQPGTPRDYTPYISPELGSGVGTITTKSDQYALAVIAAEVLSGEPIGGTVSGLREGILNRALDTANLPQLTPAARVAIQRATTPDPDRRFATSREFVLAALREVKVDATVTGEFQIVDVADEVEEDDGIGLAAPGTIGYGAPPAPKPAPAPPPQTRSGAAPPLDAMPEPAPAATASDVDDIVFGDAAPAPLEEEKEEAAEAPSPDRKRAAPEPAPPPPPRQQNEAARTDTTPVIFDAYYPRAAKVHEPIKFLVYALHEAARPAVKTDVAQYAEQLGGSVPVPVSAAEQPQLRVGTLVTVVLISDDYPETPYLTRRWSGKWVRYDFELEPPAHLTGHSFNVDVSIQVRGIEIARITDCNIFVGVGEDDPTEPTNPLAAAKFSERRTQPYQHIFVSYSRRDSSVVEAYRVAQIALGNQVFMDTYSIRSGEDWQAALARAIDEADIFQLFWSQNSAKSENVRDEWAYALDYRCKEDGCRTFIRPVYWETPLPDVPQPLQHLNFVYAKLTAQRPLLPWLLLGVVGLMALLVIVIGVLA
jgi:serine/threonine protein kinase